MWGGLRKFHAARSAPPMRRTGSKRKAAEFRVADLLSISKLHFHRIAYVEWGDPQSKRLVVCVHGLSRQGRDFDALAQALAARGYRVVCPDLVGRGKSGRLSDPDDYALPQYAVDMTMLLARLGAEEVDWVGTSLGGLIGMVLAGMPNSPIRRLVVNDIGPFLPWAALRRIGDVIRSAPRDFPDLASAEAFFRTALDTFGALTDADWRHLTIHSLIKGPDGRYHMHFDPGIAEAFRPGRVYNVSMWGYWDAIHCPTLVLRGAKSDLLLPETTAEMAQRGPRAEIVEIEGCGHAPALMDETQIRIVTDWFERTK
jgi:pimeloyl-ACP methyl ester carboxylesterase